jgi:RNA polymerase sigma-70 factor (ECF subfamily)
LRARARHHEARTPAAAPDPTIERYAALFQARDWDGVRALLAEDVQLDLVGHTRRAGAGSVGTYYSNYGHLPPFRVAHAHLEGRAGLAFYAAPADVEPAYVITLEVRDGAIAAIRDYRFVPYLLADARVTPNGAFSGR